MAILDPDQCMEKRERRMMRVPTQMPIMAKARARAEAS